MLKGIHIFLLHLLRVIDLFTGKMSLVLVHVHAHHSNTSG